MTRRAVLVVNPASDGGGTGRAWPGIAAEVRARGLEVDARLSEAPGHAVVLTREALDAGEELIVAVGGDGTVNEVVNGFAAREGSADAAALAVVERGTGADFIRTYAIPKRVREAVAVLAAGRTRRIDLGRATYAGPDGPVTRHFANVASCGLTGDVARRANAGDLRLGGTLGFLMATAAAFARWRNVLFTVDVDGQGRRLVANDVICANGRWFGGAIHIAPDADPADGLLDVLIVGDVGKLDLALNVHRLYRGTLGRHPRVETLRGRTVTVATAEPLPVELDGEQPGTTPITFAAQPSALTLVVP